MATETVSRSYETRTKTRGDNSALKSRVDWRRTKRDISQFLESEDEEYSESESQSEENSEENDGDNSSTDDDEEEEQQQLTNPVVQKEEADEECIAPTRRKRMSSVLYDPKSSSEDEEPVRKVRAKRRCFTDDESDENNTEYQGKSLKEKENASTRKHKRQAKLKALSQKLLDALKSKKSTYFETFEDEPLPSPILIEGTSGQESEDNASLEDFIVEDENEQSGESENEARPHLTSANHSVLLEHHIPVASDHFLHFQRIVKAFLINAMDDTFLISLFDGTRQKRYAKEMVASLYHFDERIIAPRLENLKSRSRWKEQYKVRVDSYPSIKIIPQSYREMPCDACGLMRSISFQVILSGESYNNKTLKEDDFMAHDRQILKVGSICAERTRIYHQLKHFKYNLLKRCISMAKLAGGDEQSIKNKVNMLFSKLEGAWIQRKYDSLQADLNEADFFQGEMMD